MAQQVDRRKNNRKNANYLLHALRKKLFDFDRVLDELILWFPILLYT